jgi:hypothetical protein
VPTIRKYHRPPMPSFPATCNQHLQFFIGALVGSRRGREF